jgi:hypothetical protein
LGENFSSVAAELSGSDGYIGWVPENAFPEFDPYLFGTDEKPATLGPGEVSDQIYADETIFLLQAIGETETREVSQQMIFRMASSLVDEWKADQLSQGSDQGWVKINFDSHRYAWVTDQVRLTRPRVTPQPQQ